MLWKGSVSEGGTHRAAEQIPEQGTEVMKVLSEVMGPKHVGVSVSSPFSMKKLLDARRLNHSKYRTGR